MFISYGAHSDTFLLLEYGFITGKNKNNFVDVSTDEIFYPLEISVNNRAEICKQSVLYGCSSGYGLNDDGITWSTIRIIGITFFIINKLKIEDYIYNSLQTWPEPIISWSTQRIEHILTKKIKTFKTSRDKIRENILRDFLEDQIAVMIHCKKTKNWD